MNEFSLIKFCSVSQKLNVGILELDSPSSPLFHGWKKVGNEFETTWGWANDESKASTKGGRPLDCEREKNEEGSFASPEQSRLPTSSSHPLRADARGWHGGWKGWWHAGRCSPYCRTGSPDTAAGGSSRSSRVRWSPAAHACTASMARLDDPLLEDWGHIYTNKRAVYYNPVMWTQNTATSSTIDFLCHIINIINLQLLELLKYTHTHTHNVRKGRSC